MSEIIGYRGKSGQMWRIVGNEDGKMCLVPEYPDSRTGGTPRSFCLTVEQVQSLGWEPITEE